MRPAGHSGPPLARKLGIRAGYSLTVLNPPPHYWDLVGPLPPGARIASAESPDLDFIHVFVRERKGLGHLLRTLRSRIKPNGMIWVSWPKKASRVATDVVEAVVRGDALAAGLVDVKVAEVDATWSGLKLVIRQRDRG